MFVSCCTNSKKKKTRLVLVPARTAVNFSLRYRTGKVKSHPLEPHFQTSATMSRSLEGTETPAALPQCSENTKESIAGWCVFESTVRLELWQSYGMPYKKIPEVEVLPVVDLFKNRLFFCGRCNTGASRSILVFSKLPRKCLLGESLFDYPGYVIG